MKIAMDMKNLTDHLMNACELRQRSHGMRQKTVRDLRLGAQRDLKKFGSDRKMMRNRQADELGQFADNLTKFSKNMSQRCQQMLKDIHANHEDMAEKLHHQLSQVTKDTHSYVNGKLKEFHQSHMRTSEELRNRIMRDLGHIHKDVKGVVDQTQSFVKECHAEMKKSRQAWMQMSGSLMAMRHNGSKCQTAAGSAYSAGNAQGHSSCKKPYAKKATKRK